MLMLWRGSGYLEQIILRARCPEAVLIHLHRSINTFVWIAFIQLFARDCPPYYSFHFLPNYTAIVGGYFIRRAPLGTVPLVMCRLVTGPRTGTLNILSVLIIASCRELNLSQRFCLLEFFVWSCIN